MNVVHELELIQKNPGAFELFYNNRLVINHSPKQPFVCIYDRDSHFKSHRRFSGSFKIKNKLLNKKSPHVLEVVRSAEEITVYFEHSIEIVIKVVNDRLTLLPATNTSVGHVQFNFPATLDEAVYGGGEQFSYLNLRGKKNPLWAQEPGIIRRNTLTKYFLDALAGAGGTWWKSYFPMPTFISSENYFIHVDTYAYGYLDFTNKSIHSLGFNAVPKKITIDVCSSPIETLSSLTSLLGKQPALPDWALDGAWLGVVGGLDETLSTSTLNKVEAALEADVPVAAVWSEDWCGLKTFGVQERVFWHWKADHDQYPELQDYITSLHRRGIKFLGYNNCFLMSATDMYNEALKKGYFVHDVHNKPFPINHLGFIAPMIDLTNPDAYVWLKNIVKQNMLAYGLDGWMCDFGSWLPVESKIKYGLSEYVHNQYPVLWAKLNAEALREAGRDSGRNSAVFFSRSGSTESAQHVPLFWTGDQTTDFSLDTGLPAAIAATISLGLAGVGHVHSDIGGYFNVPLRRRTKELYLRWVEFSAFTVVMRTHENKSKSGWTYDTDGETLEHFKKFTIIHKKLKPYIKHLLDEYQTSGTPPVRHPFIHYPDDKTFHEQENRMLQYQYLFGEDLFVAPVIKKRAKTRKLYLPKDTWVHLWTGEVYTGGFVTVAAPLGQPPIFYRQNSEFEPLFTEVYKK